MLQRLPKIVADQSVGGKAIPSFLRSQGFDVITISDMFGRPDVTDCEWLEHVGRLGIPAITKDKNIRNNKPEREAVIQHEVKLLCFSRADWTWDIMQEVLSAHMKKIKRLLQKQGPYILIISKDKVSDYLAERKRKSAPRTRGGDPQPTIQDASRGLCSPHTRG